MSVGGNRKVTWKTLLISYIDLFFQLSNRTYYNKTVKRKFHEMLIATSFFIPKVIANKALSHAEKEM